MCRGPSSVATRCGAGSVEPDNPLRVRRHRVLRHRVGQPPPATDSAARVRRGLVHSRVAADHAGIEQRGEAASRRIRLPPRRVDGRGSGGNSRRSLCGGGRAFFGRAFSLRLGRGAAGGRRGRGSKGSGSAGTRGSRRSPAARPLAAVAGGTVLGPPGGFHDHLERSAARHCGRISKRAARWRRPDA